MSVVQRKIAASRLAKRTNPCQALIVLLIVLPTAQLAQSAAFTADPQATAGPASQWVPSKPISARH